MGNLLEAVRRGWAHRKLRDGRCAYCQAVLPDSGAPCDFNTCSPECASERWAEVTA